MLMSPAKWSICQTDLAEGLATVSKKTDVSTPSFESPVCFTAVDSPSIQQSTHIFLCHQQMHYISRTNELTQIISFPGFGKRQCSAEDELYVVPTQRTHHWRGFLYVWIARTISQHVIFQSDNDLSQFHSVLLSLLIWLGKKNHHWCGGCLSAWLILLCPWLLSCLYNNFKPNFLGKRTFSIYLISLFEIYWV